MTSYEIVQEMLKLQQKLNDETNGVGWESGYTKNNRIINWRRCIYMESAELIDSFNWKHWKDINKEPDWENATIEIVDIWHFVMSLLLEFYKNNNRGDIVQLSKDIVEVKGFERFSKEPMGHDSLDVMEIVNDIESIIHITSTSKVDLFDGLLKEYFTVALKCGVNLEILYKYYVAKNVLNQFRQDHGYKEGIYKKVWGDKEDNEVMFEILEKQTLSPDGLYSELKRLYLS